MTKRKYKTGDKFGQWTLLEYATPSGTNTQWKVICSCGNVAVTASANIIAGRSTRCGQCKNKQQILGDEHYGFPMSMYKKLYHNLYHFGNGEFAKSVCKKLYDIGLRDVVSIGKIDQSKEWSLTNFVVTEFDNNSSPLCTNNFYSGDCTGVYLEYPKGRPTYVAKITFNGKRIVKSFSVKKYGELEAKRLAEKQRQLWENKVTEERMALAIQQGILPATKGTV